MNEYLKWTVVFAALVVIIMLLAGNLFVMWQTYGKVQYTQNLESRIEKSEADGSMSMAISMSSDKKANECLVRVGKLELQLQEME